MKKQNPSAQDHGIRGRKRLETAQHSLQTGVYPTAVVFAAQAESDLFDAGDADAAGEAMAIRRQALRSLGAKQNPDEDDFVKVHFPGEAMWVLQTGADTGILDNEPVSHLHDAKLGDEIQWRVQKLPRSKGQFLEFVRVVKRAAAKNPGEEILNMKQNPVTRVPNRTARPAPKGHYYKVLDKKGRVIAFTTTKAEAESVCPAGGRVQHL